MQYLTRLLHAGSHSAMILKCADRISNLTDLHLDIFHRQKMSSYLDQSEKYVLPMAQKVNTNMEIELKDLIQRRRKILE